MSIYKSAVIFWAYWYLASMNNLWALWFWLYVLNRGKLSINEPGGFIKWQFYSGTLSELQFRKHYQVIPRVCSRKRKVESFCSKKSTFLRRINSAFLASGLVRDGNLPDIGVRDHGIVFPKFFRVLKLGRGCPSWNHRAGRGVVRNTLASPAF